ncbi:MAG: hypothetical protein KKB50_05055 [Planctomycetes bacterium]|nr:hypothetical protein [Planctomycetota bacterium]
MIRTIRARRAACMVIAWASLATVSAQLPPKEEESERTPGPPSRLPSFCRLYKHFDFDERPLGNYEDTPMYWDRLRGAGLPAYNRGRFDEQLGHDAAPSFYLNLSYGNVAYEYRGPDLHVVPASDYMVVGRIRPDGLQHARAFLAAYLVNSLGEPIAGSQRVSNLVQGSLSARSRSDVLLPGPAPRNTAEPWQEVEIHLPGDVAEAYAVRVQVWILQAYVWGDPTASNEADPVVRQDVQVGAWFDDITVYRLPRVRLGLSNGVGIVRPRYKETFVCEVCNASGEPLPMELEIADRDGNVQHTQATEVPPFSTAPQHWPVPPLDPGWYEARLWLLADPHGTAQPTIPGEDAGSSSAPPLVVQRRIHFAVLAELPPSAMLHPDIGFDLGPWKPSDITGLRDLLVTARCGAVKVGIPVLNPAATDRQQAYFGQIADLIQHLGAAGIDSTGVILSQTAAVNPTGGTPTHKVLAMERDWRRQSSPILTSLAGLLPTWQLGDERLELSGNDEWSADAIEQMHAHLGKFVTRPKLVIPRSIFGPSESSDATGDSAAITPPNTYSILVPSEIPARMLPRQLAFLAEPSVAPRWLSISPDTTDNLEPRLRLADLAQRLVIAQALAPDRIYLPAPFELTHEGGGLTWEPKEEYAILRTLFHYLSGAEAVGAMALGDDAILFVFSGSRSDCLIAWTWRDSGADAPVELYLGAEPTAVDLWGNRQAVDVIDGKSQLRLGPLPLIVDTVHAPLVLLQASVHLEPYYVQVHDPAARPVLTFRNPYSTHLSGTLRIRAPEGWTVAPEAAEFGLQPGESFELPLDLVVPPRPLAAQREFQVRLDMRAPAAAELDLTLPIVVGLRDVVAEVNAYWRDDGLLVEHSLRNLSGTPASFAGFCQAPDHAREEREFLDIAPGEVETQRYFFPAARALRGLLVHVGIREIRGPRKLDQLVEVPQ